MNILIADDKEEGRYLLEVLLKGNGHDVTAVANGAEAIERLKSGGFELIISDILMPVMDGFELCRKVKTDKALRRIPFIIYTATYTDPQDEAYALKIGADRFILKPCEPEIFLTAIEEVMAAAGRQDIASLPILKEEKETYRLYSERLVKKLEDKMMQLEQEIQARQESEKVAQLEAERWRTTFNAMLDPVSIMSADGAVEQCNTAFASFIGQDPQAIIGQKCHRLIHRTEDYIPGCPIVRSRQSGVREEMELLIGKRTFLVVADPIKTAAGKLTGFVHVIRDLTERKRMEEALRESEGSFRAVTENANDGIIVAASDGTHLYANKRAAEITGYSIDELLKIGMKGLAHPDEIPKLSERLEKRLAGEEVPKQYETRIVHKEGKTVDVGLAAAKTIWHGQAADLVIVKDITELKRSQETLLKEKTFSDTAINSLAGIFYLFDEQGCFLRWNTNFNVVTGYSDEEISTMHPLDFFTDEEKEKIKATIQEVFSEGSSFVEAYLLSKDGSRTPYFFTGRRFVLDNQKYLTGMGIDISQLKKAETALRESEEKFRELYDNAPVGYHEIDYSGIITRVNLTETEMLGYSFEEMIGQPIWNFLLEGEKSKHYVLAKLTGRLPPGRQFERTYRRKDGAIFPVLIEDRLLRDLDGKIVGMRSTIQDITELKRAEETLRKSEEAYRNLVETARDVIFTVYPDGTLASLNPAFNAITGWSVDDWVGKPFSLLLHPDDLPLAMEKFRRSLLQEGLNEIFELRISTRSGGYVVGEFIIAPQIQNEKVINILGIARDITERKRAEQEMASLQEQLRQSQKMEAIGRLAGGIAHDFNNLLTVIKGNSQLSLHDLREGDPLKVNIEEIRSASERASDLIRQLLAFSRKQIMEMQVLDVNLILKRLDNMLHRVLGEDIELVTILTEGIGKIKADPGQIEQVIVNLAVNSRDAMPDGGKLTIETANVELDEEYARKHIAVKPGQYVMFSVSDTGMGMTPEVQERVFEPFYTTKEIGKGTGLGLSTVYGIVKQSGGNIWVYSEGGKGTAFKIYLPQVDEPLTELKEVVSKGIPRGDETILIVEDEETVRKLAVRILKSLGYRIFEAPEGGRALILCEEFKERIHLILTDVVMPGMSGPNLVKRLREIHPEMGVLYMSGYTDNAILHHGVLEEGTNFIQKPFTLENLARKVREVLDKV